MVDQFLSNRPHQNCVFSIYRPSRLFVRYKSGQILHFQLHTHSISIYSASASTSRRNCYDPPSLFLLDLFRYIDAHQNMTKFLQLVRDKDRGRCYRTHAGISEDNIPCEGTFSIFRTRLGEKLYNEIFHVLVDIFHQLEMITFKILAHDGTLYPTWARYKGLPSEMQLRCFPPGISPGKLTSAINAVASLSKMSLVK